MNTKLQPAAKISVLADGHHAQRQVAGGEDFRDIKATLTQDEFWAVRWCQQRHLVDLPNGKRGGISLAGFFRKAVLRLVHETVRGEIAWGRKIPPDIAAVVDRTRAEACGEGDNR